MEDGGKNERTSLAEWWSSLHEAAQLAVVIVGSILAIIIAVLMFVEPIVFCFRLRSLVPLLLYAIPGGILLGATIWNDIS